MKCLYIDTSSSYLYTAIVENNNLISSISEDYGTQLSEVALPRITSMFEDNNLKPTDIDKIIVVNGPGSFTGVRIGITIAKVYAWSLNIPITTVNALEVMSISTNDDRIHVPIINARRGYVYAAIYDHGEMLLKPQHIKLTDLEEKFDDNKNYVYISNDDFDDDITTMQYAPQYTTIVNKFIKDKSINPHMVNPEYLKKTEAEEKNDLWAKNR